MLSDFEMVQSLRNDIAEIEAEIVRLTELMSENWRTEEMNARTREKIVNYRESIRSKEWSISDYSS